MKLREIDDPVKLVGKKVHFHFEPKHKNGKMLNYKELKSLPEYSEEPLGITRYYIDINNILILKYCQPLYHLVW